MAHTYEEMRRRQKIANQNINAIEPEPEPVPLPEGAEVDSVTLNTPAIDDSVAVAPPAEPQAPAAPKGPMTFDETRAKRIVVLKALRNSPGGVERFAHHIRRAYGVSKDFKATPEEILSAGFRIQKQTIPDLTSDEYIKAMQKLYGEKVDSSLLEQARIDYPGHSDEKALINEMYQRHVAREEKGPISYEDKAQIIARRFPELHKSSMEPDQALRLAYDTQKKKGKDVGSYEDWLHSQMAPTLAERGYGLAGDLWKGILEQGKSVVTLGKELATPGQLATDVALVTKAGDSEAGQEAKERLKGAGMGAVNVAAAAAGPLAGAGLRMAAGASKIAPALLGAAEGMAAGGVQAGGQAAVEGKPLGEVAQAAAQGAGLAGAIGAGLGGLHGRSVARRTAKEAAEAEAELQAAREAGSAELPPPVSAPAGQAPVTDTLELAARHDAETRFQSNIAAFAKKHGMEHEDAARLVAAEEPSIQDLAAANVRHGVTADEIAELRAAMPEHMKVPSAEPVPPPGAPSVESSPTAAVAPAAAAERGLVETPLSARMTTALNKAQGQLEKRRAMIRQQLSARLAKARETYGAVGGGLAGLKAKLSVMAGEMKKPDWAGVADEFADIDTNVLIDTIERSAMMEGDKLTAQAGLRRLLNGTKMGAPTLSQIRALRLAFGSEFADAAMKNRTVVQSHFQTAMRVLNTPRTLMTSLDLSAGMRQGYLMTSRPEYYRAWNTMRKAFGNEAVEDAVVSEIRANPKYDVMRANGLVFQGEKMLGERSETFAGSLVDRWAGVRQSQRAYDTFINKLRADVFSNVYDEMAAAGVDVSDPHFRQSLAHWINTGTGRGSMALLGRDAGLLNAIAFSPRLAWSRLETFNIMYYKGLHPSVRVAALKANAKTAAATMTLLGVMAGSGLAAVGWDPRSSNFAKLRFGNTRVDLLGGHQQFIKLFAQLSTGKVVSSVTGKEIDLNGSDEKNGFKREGMTRIDVLAKFIEAKASPLASLALNIGRGEDFLGKPISIPNEVLTRLTPMPIQDVYEAIKESGPAGIAVAPAALVGLGVQSYGPSLPVSAGGAKEPETGLAMEGVNMAGRLWNHLNGIAPDRDMRFVTPQLADQWVKDAAMAQVMGQQEAQKVKGFFDRGFDQKSEIRKATARRMRGINKLYKDLAGANGEQARLAAERNMLQRRAEVTGMDIEALRNPNVYSEVTK